MSNTKNTNGNNIGFYKVLCGILATATFSLILFNGYLTTNTSQLTGSAMDDRLDRLLEVLQQRRELQDKRDREAYEALERKKEELWTRLDCSIAYHKCMEEWDSGCAEEANYCTSQGHWKHGGDPTLQP